MLAMGLLGWLLEENGFPIAPIILGLVLGELFEQSFMTSMIKADGSLIAFFTRPIAAALGIMTLALWGYMLSRHKLAQRSAA
jgi:TctA family transporter